MEIDNCTLAPFYEHMQTILDSKPLDLNIKKCSKKLFDFKGSHICEFTLNSDMIHLLSESRTKSTKLDVRIIIRFCKIVNVTDSEGNNLSVTDVFPQHLRVYIDGKLITLPKYLPYDSDRRDGRRNARLIDVTDTIVDTKILQHQFIIQWVQDDCQEYFNYSLHLVRRRSLHNLSYSLTRSQTCSIKRTTSLFRDHIYYPSSNKDIEYMVQTRIVKTVSLICPISLCRIIIPARGIFCTHLQCFDLDTYLLMNFMKPTWICPICDENAYFTCLEIDGLILSILNEKRSQSISEIKFNEEGHWKSNDCINDEDTDEIYFGIPKSYSLNKFNENEEKIAEEISSKLSRKQMNIDLLKLLPPTNWNEYKLPVTILNALCSEKTVNPQSNPSVDIIKPNTPTDVDTPLDNAIIPGTKRSHLDSLTDFSNNCNKDIPIKKSKLTIKTIQKENITNLNKGNSAEETRHDSNSPADSFDTCNKDIPITKSKLALKNIPKESITSANNKKAAEDETKNDSEFFKKTNCLKELLLEESSSTFLTESEIQKTTNDFHIQTQFQLDNQKILNIKAFLCHFKKNYISVETENVLQEETVPISSYVESPISAAPTHFAESPPFFPIEISSVQSEILSEDLLIDLNNEIKKLPLLIRQSFLEQFRLRDMQLLPRILPNSSQQLLDFDETPLSYKSDDKQRQEVFDEGW